MHRQNARRCTVAVCQRLLYDLLPWHCVFSGNPLLHSWSTHLNQLVDVYFCERIVCLTDTHKNCFSSCSARGICQCLCNIPPCALVLSLSAINTSFMMDNKWLHSRWQIVWFCFHFSRLGRRRCRYLCCRFCLPRWQYLWGHPWSPAKDDVLPQRRQVGGLCFQVGLAITPINRCLRPFKMGGGGTTRLLKNVTCSRSWLCV